MSFLSNLPNIMTAEADWWNSSAITALAIAVATMIFTIFTKTVIGIYQAGVKFRSTFVTKEEQTTFEREIIRDMREYKQELLDVLMAAAMETIREKLKDVDSLRETAINMQGIEAAVRVQVKSVMEKYENLQSLEDNVRALNSKVERLEYGNDGTNPAYRRKER